MIENLLLDPDAIHEVLKPFGTSTPARTPDDVRTLLSQIADERIEDEVRLRIKQQLPIGRLEIEPHELLDSTDLDALVSRKSATWAARLRELGVGNADSITDRARNDVEAIVAAGKQQERFHGKRILQKLHQRLNVNGVGLSQTAFATQIAAPAACGERLRRLTDAPISAITLYIPSTLTSTVTAASADSGTSALAKQCHYHRAAWERGEPDPTGRAELRRDIFALARTLEPGTRANLTALAAEIGTA
ncbi:hypothetical protein [Amycolatopsis speibonae]|uniref:DUF222 domain-containing protein n=1 Tax=Amycolatopsis speibonae TaxID=1450224 RepID=A0ABV7P4L4_9PSEU